MTRPGTWGQGWVRGARVGHERVCVARPGTWGERLGAWGQGLAMKGHVL